MLVSCMDSIILLLLKHPCNAQYKTGGRELQERHSKKTNPSPQVAEGIKPYI